jgi:hypothetical protein
MADYVLLGLVIAVVVVGILLMSCWKNKPGLSRNSSNGGNSGFYNTGRSRNDNTDGRNSWNSAPAPRSNYGAPGCPMETTSTEMGQMLRSGGISRFGTAQENRDYAMRMDNVATELGGYDGYSDITRYVGLDNSVYQSHNAWTKDMGHSTTTASMQSERDDLGDLPNPWTGLRRPNFTDNPGIEASARVDASFTKDQMPTYRHFVL